MILTYCHKCGNSRYSLLMHYELKHPMMWKKILRMMQAAGGEANLLR